MRRFEQLQQRIELIAVVLGVLLVAILFIVSRLRG